MGIRAAARLVSHGSAPAPDGAGVGRHVDVPHRSPHADECVSGLRESSWRCAVNAPCRKAEAKISASLIEREPLTRLVICFAWRRLPHRQFKLIVYRPNPPPHRNPPEVGVLEAIGEEVGDGLGQTWIAAFGLGGAGVGNT